MGEHDGLAFYTIGQRHIGKITNSKSQISNKLQNPNSKPLYVVGKDIKNNCLLSVIRTMCCYTKTNQCNQYSLDWWACAENAVEVRGSHSSSSAVAKMRCRDASTSRRSVSTVETNHNAPTAGQFAVFYKNGECLGGD